jgi:hypothetical protein
MRASRVLGFAILGAVAAVFLAGCGSGGTRHPLAADAATTASAAGPGRALQLAAKAMASAPSYRFIGSITTGALVTGIIGEFQAPDRLHEVITPPGGAVVETVFIGGRAYVLDRATGRWSHATQPANASGPQDPRLAFSVLQHAEHVTATGTSYLFSLPPSVAGQLLQAPSSSGATAGQGTATASATGITHLEFDLTLASRAIRVVLDYTSIGQGPPVSQPV